jgi:hypothetical protein
MKRLILLSGSVLLMGAHAPQQPPMTFFITSAGSGDGANLGGTAGADKICTDLAAAAGSRGITWRAYISVGAVDGKPMVNARDRIGMGPWHNAKGVMVARNVDDLHGPDNKLGKEHSLTEKGEVVNGRGDTPNQHDIITGSTLHGTLFVGDNYDNCKNFTSNSAGSGSVRVGHHDRQGGGENPTHWGSAHGSRGCSQANLVATGGSGRFYCFGFAAGGENETGARVRVRASLLPPPRLRQ